MKLVWCAARGELNTETEAILIFLVVLMARVVTVLALPDITIANQQVIFGDPISDAAHWHQVASEIALGEGINTTLRPLYSLLLSLPQQFFGNDVIVAKLTNCVIDSGSIIAGYFIFRHLLPRPAPLVIALSVGLLPNYILFSHSLLSEHAGALFLLAALVPMLRKETGAQSWALAGLFTGLSNLARPLTLLAVPAPIAVAFYFGGRRFIWAFSAFALVVCVTISPWLILQYERIGIFSLSSNTTQVLAGATNPKYGQWTGAIQADKIAEGVSAGTTIKEWDRIFKEDIARNLRQWPLFWPRNIAKNLWESLNDGGLWLQQNVPLIVALAAIWTLCGAFLARRRNAFNNTELWVLTLCALMVVAAIATGKWVMLLAAGAAFCGLYSARCSALLSTYLVGCMFGHSFFGFSTSLDRMEVMYVPLVLGLDAAAFMSLGFCLERAVRLWWSPQPVVVPAKSHETQNGPVLEPLWMRVVAVTTAIVLIVACGRLTSTYIWRPTNIFATFANTGSDPLEAMQRVKDQLTRDPSRLAGVDHPAPLVVSYFRFPLNYIRVPDALAGKLGAHDPLYIFFIGFSELGVRWTIVSARDVTSMLGKQYVAVVADGSNSNDAIPDLVYLGRLSRVLAMAPRSPQGIDMGRLILNK